MGAFMNTRRSGIASGHVTAELEALTNEATIGAGNFVFEAGDKFAITVTPGTGEVSVSSGIFSWGGRLGGVDTFEIVKYTPPTSETLYKKIAICAKYSKDSAVLTEDISFVAIESESQASESAAAGLTLDLGNDVINTASENAYLPLWEFIATSNSHTVPVQKFKTIKNLSFILNEISEIKTTATEETEKREEADKALDSRIGMIEKGYELISDSIAGSSVNNVEIKKYIAFVLMIQVEKDSTKLTPFIIPAIVGTYYYPRYKFESRTLGGYDITKNYAYAQVYDYGTIRFANENSEELGTVKKIYGIK